MHAAHVYSAWHGWERIEHTETGLSCCEYRFYEFLFLFPFLCFKRNARDGETHDSDGIHFQAAEAGGNVESI